MGYDDQGIQHKRDIQPFAPTKEVGNRPGIDAQIIEYEGKCAFVKLTKVSDFYSSGNAPSPPPNYDAFVEGYLVRPDQTLITDEEEYKELRRKGNLIASKTRVPRADRVGLEKKIRDHFKFSTAIDIREVRWHGRPTTISRRSAP